MLVVVANITTHVTGNWATGFSFQEDSQGCNGVLPFFFLKFSERKCHFGGFSKQNSDGDITAYCFPLPFSFLVCPVLHQWYSSGSWWSYMIMPANAEHYADRYMGNYYRTVDPKPASGCWRSWGTYPSPKCLIWEQQGEGCWTLSPLTLHSSWSQITSPHPTPWAFPVPSVFFLVFHSPLVMMCYNRILFCLTILYRI